jgi:hypothetical protein
MKFLEAITGCSLQDMEMYAESVTFLCRILVQLKIYLNEKVAVAV